MAVPVEIVDGLAERLPVGDSSADAAVCALVLCSIADHGASLREVRRVLRADGEFRLIGARRIVG